MSYTHPRYLISAEELARDLDNPKRRIFDSTVHLRPADRGYRAESGLPEFLDGHVPGARFLDLIDDASDTSTGLGFSLPPVAQLEALLRRHGVDDETEVVFYSTGHMMWATRAWWLAYYCGHANIRVLDGGYRGWSENGHPTSPGDSDAVDAGSFTAKPRGNVFVAKDDVLGAIGDTGVCTINALAPDVYSGEGGTNYGRPGHIAGSSNLYYSDLMASGYFKSADELRDILGKHGLLDAPRIISYCGGGISATIDSFACLLVGQEQVAVYDGSMSEWVRDESLPMRTGEEP